jgi:hypothetical protein
MQIALHTPEISFRRKNISNANIHSRSVNKISSTIRSNEVYKNLSLLFVIFLYTEIPKKGSIDEN